MEASEVDAVVEGALDTAAAGAGLGRVAIDVAVVGAGEGLTDVVVAVVDASKLAS